MLGEKGFLGVKKKKNPGTLKKRGLGKEGRKGVTV